MFTFRVVTEERAWSLSLWEHAYVEQSAWYNAHGVTKTLEVIHWGPISTANVMEILRCLVYKVG